MSNTNTNFQTQTSDALYNAIMDVGGKDCPPMLAPVAEGSSETITEGHLENYNNVSQDIRNQLDAEAARSVEEEITGDGIKEIVEMPRSQPIGYYLKHEINEKLIEGLIGIAKDVLVKIAGYVYPLDFMILDVKEDKKKPFILGKPFLTTTKAEIIFDKGIITLKSSKKKINFFKIPKSPCRVEEETKNDIDLVAPTNTVSRLILEWKERIKLHQEK
nr:hypothetical protein [Tanacetum cinerariifolium]